MIFCFMVIQRGFNLQFELKTESISMPIKVNRDIKLKSFIKADINISK